MKKGRKKLFVVIVILLILCISIGYAALSDNFKIKGTTNITGNTWALSFTNIQVDTSASNVTASTAPHIVTGTSSDDYTQQVEYEVTLAKPKDVYVFTVDLQNTGSIDAEISSVSLSGLTSNASQYIEYTVKDVTNASSPRDAAVGDIISASGGKKTYKVTTQFKDVTNEILETYASSSVTLTLKFEINLVQHT